MQEYSREPSDQPEIEPALPPSGAPTGPLGEPSAPGGAPAPAGTPGSVAPTAQAPRQVRVPIKLPNPRPIWTYILLGIIVAIYLASQVFPEPPATIVKGYTVRNTEEWLVVMFAKINPFILQDGEVYRMLTAIFLHGGLAHLFFNGYALYIVGRDIERLYGHARFLVIYFLGGLTSSLASMVLNPGAWSVGASGSLFAIFGAERVFFFRHRRLFGPLATQRLNNLVYLLVMNLFIGIFGSALIDNWAHVGGFLAGLGLAWLISPQFKAIPPTPANPVVELEDTNPFQARLWVPFAWLAGLVAAVGLLLLGQG